MIDARSSHGVHVEIERSPDPESFGAGTVTVVQRTNFQGNATQKGGRVGKKFPQATRPSLRKTPIPYR